jgi:hypothetical protein
MENVQPTLRLQKNVDSAQNKMVIPRTFVKKWGKSFYMDVYDDKIVIIPIKKGE